MPKVQANGLSLEYDERGEGEPLLLIMGLGAQMIRWPEAFCDKLAAKGFRVIRFDNRDIGLSQKMDDAPFYTLADMAADALGVLDGLGIDKAHIVGASMGGMIAQILVADHPDRVLSFTSIMSTTGEKDLPPATPAAMAVLGTPMPDPRTDLEGFLEVGVKNAHLLGSPAYPGEAAMIRARLEREFRRSYFPTGFQRQYAAVLASPPGRAKIAAITAPTLVIHGEADPLVPVEGGRDTAAHIKGAQLLTIPGMGHDLPDALFDQMVDAIAKNAGRA